MKAFEHFLQRYKESGMLHHAYLFSGNVDELELYCKKFLEEEAGIPGKRNPDFFYGTYDTFGIDDSRMVRRWHSVRAFREGRRACLIKAMSLTSEAQNALLKIFEEPGENTHFILIVPHEEIILPTLRSRLETVTGTVSPGDAVSHGAKTGRALSGDTFLTAPTPARLLLLREIIAEKDKNHALSFLDDLEHTLAARARDTKSPARHLHSWANVLRGKRYLRTKGASLKLVLEHLALVLPRG